VSGFTEVRLVTLRMCALVAASVVAAMFLSIWSTRRAPSARTTPRQRFAAELVWAAIPCFMILAAAAAGAIAIVSGH